MNRVQYRIEENDRLIGFRCNTPTGTRDFPVGYIRQNINDFDIRVWGKGFRFKDSSRSILDLPKVSNSKPYKGVKRDIGITWYTGDNLRIYSNNFLNGIYRERDFIGIIRNLIKSTKFNRVISISGIRGVGKTVGLLQTVQSLNCYNDKLF